MAEADAALREEMEKVRERTRGDALARGLPPQEAEARAAAAVEAFCAKWGIRPEVVFPAPRPALTPLPKPVVTRTGIPAGAVAAATALADRRRRIVEEFDRTCVEVQGMIEDRIAESRGLGAPAAPGEGSGARDLAAVARDLDRLREGLRNMLALCEELRSHLDLLAPSGSSPGGEPPAGGAR